MDHDPAAAVAALPALYKKYAGDERRLLALVRAKFAGVGRAPEETEQSSVSGRHEIHEVDEEEDM